MPVPRRPEDETNPEGSHVQDPITPPADQAPPTPATPPDPAAQQAPELLPHQRMTQADFNARIAQAERSGIRSRLIELGYEGLETTEGVDAAITQLRADVEFARQAREAGGNLETAQTAQLQELQTQLATERTARAQAVAELEQRTTAFTELQMQVAIDHELPGFENSTDVVLWMRAYRPDEYAGLLDEKGVIDQTKLKALIGQCRQERPKWFAGSHKGSPSNAGGQMGTPGKKTTDDARQVARKNLR